MATTSLTLTPAWQALHVAPYRERLSIPVSWWLRALVFVLTVWWVVLVASTMAIASSTALLAAALVIGVLRAYGSAELIVSDEWFTAGRASIERKFCGAITILDADEFRLIMGPHADARAYLLTRAYVPQGLLVHIEDPRDPTPYWLVSSRDPQRLAAALQAI